MRKDHRVVCIMKKRYLDSNKLPLKLYSKSGLRLDEVGDVGLAMVSWNVTS